MQVFREYSPGLTVLHFEVTSDFSSCILYNGAFIFNVLGGN